VEGKKRSIIDMTAYAPQEYRFEATGGSEGYFFETSSATPTVGAAMIDFINMWKRVHQNNLIDDPGKVFVAMLLMGDRQGQSGRSSMASTSGTARAVCE
jgi:hypothetical protein